MKCGESYLFKFWVLQVVGSNPAAPTKNTVDLRFSAGAFRNGLPLIDTPWLRTGLSAQHPPMGSRPEQSKLQSESRQIQTLVFVADA